MTGMSDQIGIRIVDVKDVKAAYNLIFNGTGDINRVKLSNISTALCLTLENTILQKISFNFS